MSLAQGLTTYLTLNLLIVFAYIALRGFSGGLSRLSFQISSGSELKLHYFVVSLVVGLALLHPFLPRNEFVEPVAKVWSAESFKKFPDNFKMANQTGYLSLPAKADNALVDTNAISLGWLILSGVVLLFGAARMTRDIRSLLKIQSQSFLIKRVFNVRVFASDEVRVPFSYWLPGHANIVVPSALIASPSEYRMALMHELQHHRHGDTKMVYAMWGLKLICLPNPFIHLWNQWLSEIQEFACDETLVDQNKVESQAYARCLIEVAQTAIHQEYVPVCATGLTFLIERNILKRRIEKMFAEKKRHIGWSIRIAFGALLALVMGGTAYAAKGLVQDRRVTIAQAQVMAEATRKNTEFPIVINDLVLKQLNRYLGTSEGREYMRDSLRRMESYRPMIESKLKEYGAPYELLALPIIESGYENLADNNQHGHGAGLWMFIKSTARAYGLRVDNEVDERLNVDLLTDAAMRYLGANNLRFRDWHLAALAYNVGENALQKGINETGSRDAWTLIRNGVENDNDYLPRLMAAVLILRNPSSVE